MAVQPAQTGYPRFHSDLSPLNEGQGRMDVQPVGVYTGFDGSVETTSSARFTPGVIEIEDHRDTVDHQARFEITEEFVVSDVTTTTPYIIAQWEFEATSDDDDNPTAVVSFLTSGWPVPDGTLIIGKGEFNGSGDLISVNTNIRTVPRAVTMKAWDYIVQSQRDLEFAIQDASIRDIFVVAANGPYQLYHVREGRQFDLPATPKRLHGSAIQDTSTGLHFTTQGASTAPLLPLQDALIVERIGINLTNQHAVVGVDAAAPPDDFVTIRDSYSLMTSSSAALVNITTDWSDIQLRILDSHFDGWDHSPVSGTPGDAQAYKWFGNTAEGNSGGWTDNDKTRIESGSRGDAETLSGSPLTEASTLGSAADDEVVTASIIRSAINAAAQGIEGAATDASALPDPTTTDLEVGDIYWVTQDTDTAPSYVQAESGSPSYPGGLWQTVDTDADDDPEEWSLLSAEAITHAPQHRDGGFDELDVAELAGGLGSADQVPVTDGAAVSWQTPSQFGRGTLLNTVDLGAQSTASNPQVDLDTNITTQYDHYLIVMKGMGPSIDDVVLYARFFDDGAGVWRSGSGDYQWGSKEYADMGGTLHERQLNGVPNIHIMGRTSTPGDTINTIASSGLAVNGSMLLMEPRKTDRWTGLSSNLRGNGGAGDGDRAIAAVHGHAAIKDRIDVSGIRFFLAPASEGDSPTTFEQFDEGILELWGM